MPKYNKEEIEEARKYLKKLLHPGDVVYTDVTHVASSGMSRHIRLILIRQNQPMDITWWVSRVVGYNLTKNGDLQVGGCGMDMGFAVVYSMSSTLFPKGFTCSGDKEKRHCRSNDHSNGDRNYKPHKHSDGGYALVQRWL